MQTRVLAGIVLVAVFASALPVRGQVRVGDAEVRAGPRGGPCFTICPREERFCLARQRDGSIVVHQIWNGDREGRKMYGCLPPGDD